MDLNTVIRKIDFCFLDIETTGLDPTKDRICEIALLWEWRGEPREVYAVLINPECDIPREASKIHGITTGRVKEVGTFADIAKEVRSWLKNEVVVAHNARFDLRFITKEFKNAHKRLPKIKVAICTQELARRHYRLRKNELGYVARSLGITVAQEHRALFDVLLLQRVFRRFLRELRVNTLGELIELQGGIIPFPPRGDP